MSISNTNRQAIFLQGSVMRHVVVMTLTSAIGLMSFFLVDLADLYFLSLLGKPEITAAIGYAGTISFVNLSISIGVAIAAAALVARHMGAGQPERAKDFATSAMLFSICLALGYTLAIALAIEPLLRLLGAEGAVLEQAKQFIWTLSPGFVLMAAAVNCSFSLRGFGDASRAMYVTLFMAFLTAALDPLFIFGFGLEMKGAALANVIAEGLGLAVGLHGLARVHKALRRFSFAALARDFAPIWAISFPAILTQLATPFAIAYTTYAVAKFGNDAVAASAITGRLVPVAFGIVFSLSGAVGPIIGQNFGARQFARVQQALLDGLKFSVAYTLATSLVLLLFRNEIGNLFLATGRTHELVVFFCSWIAASWIFTGAQFVSAAAFNNLGKPSYSTFFNWGRATLGTIPFAMIGARIAGPEGIMSGIAIGSAFFGIASVFTAFRIVRNLSKQN